MHQMTDDELMLEYQKGSDAAMEELFARHKDRVFRFAFRMSQNACEAKDLTQEVFFRVHRFRDTYRPQGKFTTWLLGIAHHAFVSKLRKDKWFVLWPRKKDDPDEFQDFASPDPSPADNVAGNERVELVKECIQSLPLLQREALVLREYENLDYNQIADILRKPQGAVKTLIYRARQALKNKLLPILQEEGGLR